MILCDTGCDSDIGANLTIVPRLLDVDCRRGSIVTEYSVENGSTDATAFILRKKRVLITDKGAQSRYSPVINKD